ncbi:hypothetical protein PS928_03258 [Pseudomonas fluorescens]|uniref:Uncharacterized protein n=1 Tax=Pseudomonas fluorescens TaxID=294 RepID=A0A5E7UB02_PSEFL|nr:hypothetical protein PS928_03258 [Pseudomonas fluorescens]
MSNNPKVKTIADFTEKDRIAVPHPDATAALALLSVDKVSLEYRTPQRVVRATHQVSFEIDPADRFVLAFALTTLAVSTQFGRDLDV